MIRALLNCHKWIHPRVLPNKPGFRFVAKLADGQQIDCELYVKSEFAIRCSVRSDEKADLKFADIVDWREV